MDRVIVNRWSSVDAEALVARVVSTCQAKLSSSGGVGCRDGTPTWMVSSPGRMKNSQSRSAPGSASGSTRALASPTAIRRSSMSSRVKSRRAASPADVVRSTET